MLQSHADSIESRASWVTATVALANSGDRIRGAVGAAVALNVPANALTVRELFPADLAHWRLPTLLFCSAAGMATGGWLGGVLYDRFGYYGPAFATAVAVNILNLAIITTLVWRQTSVAALAR